MASLWHKSVLRLTGQEPDPRLRIAVFRLAGGAVSAHVDSALFHAVFPLTLYDVPLTLYDVLYCTVDSLAFWVSSVYFYAAMICV